MTTRADLLAQLEQDRPECPVCHTPVVPSRGPVRILTFPIDDGQRVALLPVHERCEREALAKIDQGKTAVRMRAAGLAAPWN